MHSGARRWFQVAGTLLVAAVLFTLTYEVLDNAAYKRCGLTPPDSPEYPASEYPMVGASGFHLERSASGFTCVYDDGPVERLDLGWFNL